VVCHPHPRVLTISVLIVAQIFGGVLKERRMLDRVVEEFKLHIPRRESSVCGCGCVIYKAVAAVDTRH
jgi:hypothetical protein